MNKYTAKNLDDFIKKASLFNIDNAYEFGDGIYVPKDSIEYIDDEDQWGKLIKNVHFETVDENGNDIGIPFRKELEIRDELLSYNVDESAIDAYESNIENNRMKEEQRARALDNPNNRLNIRP
jgi:hypothetical protein